jgi:diguanylate cyclase (GGDEF)-like protein/PAS domain S-box-containing protein
MRVPVSLLDITQQQQTEKQLSQVIRGASLGFWDWEIGSGRHYVNDRWLELLGLDRQDIANHVSDWSDRIHPEDRKRIEPIVLDHIKRGLPYVVEFRMRHKNGHWVWIQGSGSGVEYTPDSNPVRACGTHQDITERKRSEEALHTLVETMVGLSGNDFFYKVTRELCQWLDADGATIGEILDDDSIRSLATVIDGEVVEDFHRPLMGTPCEAVLRELKVMYPEGVQRDFPQVEQLCTFHVEGYVGTAIQDQQQRVIGIIWVISRRPLRLPPQWSDVLDIIAARTSAEIERIRSMEQLEYQATFDALTDLPNRRLLLDRLHHALALCRRHNHKGGLLFLDLDHFKSINDSLGHGTGDELLTQIARRIHDMIRDEDTPARLGGDEFVVLFPELSDDPQMAAQQARQVAQKLQQDLSRPYQIRDNELHVTPSIGIVIFPMQDETAEDVLKHADIALYRAKQAGRNTISFFLPNMQEMAEERLQLKHDLRLALLREAFHLEYQPQVNVEGRIIGAEALLRWPHSRRGIIPPDTFIPVAEENGQILQIGEWVLRKALQQYKRWQEKRSLTSFTSLAVNVSPIQFHQANFTRRILSILRETGVDPRHLTLEITEGTLVENLEEARRKIKQLNRLGVRFSIDDFGTGYASIAYLRRLPLNELKIDRSFVRDILTDSRDANLVETIITMAQHMLLDMVAEGVESAAQFAFLTGKGCRIFQGNHFSRPLTADAFDDLLLQQSQ